jgi:hypothetical protein
MEMFQRKELDIEDVRKNIEQDSLFVPSELKTVNLRADASTASVNYLEARQVYHHPLVNDPIPAKRKVLRLGRILNNFLELNKNSYIPEVLTLEIEWAPNKIGYTTTSAPSFPVAGQAAFDSAGNGISISNIQMYHCVETDGNLILQLEKQVQAGLKIPVPVTTIDRLQMTGITADTPWSKDIFLNPGTHGGNTQKIVTCVNNINEAASHLMYDRDNTNGSKVKTYRTKLNDNDIQQFSISCLSDMNESYQLHKEQLEHSPTLNQNMFEYFWFHCDDWADNVKNKDKLVLTGMKNNSQKYTFSCEVPGAGVTATGNQVVYSFIVGQKYMYLKENEVFTGLTSN